MKSEDGLRAILLRAALKHSEEDGDVPSLRAVARAAGVSAMAPYRHFEDKAALLAAVASRGFAILGDELTAAVTADDPREAIYGQGVAFTRFARAHPALFRLMFGAEHGHAAVAAVERTDDVLDRRARELAPERAAAAKLACRALVQGLAAIEASGRLEAGDDPEHGIRFLTDSIARN